MNAHELIDGYQTFVDAEELAESAAQDLAPTATIFSIITTTATTTPSPISL
ncbi:LxmA leader domain family RiPP [Streptomyces sp. NPDC008313]|uniref:LxmA leader domain family RiPP n=1 Tax=Streptomyces sp. NPDC008313 TaxID=3364826 RepID=UPI0036E9650F